MPRFSVTVDSGWRDEALVLDALDAALAASPLNASWRDGEVVAHEQVRIAVQLPGPVAPVIAAPWDIDTLRSRDPESFTAPELAGATFTVVFAPEIDALEPLLVPRQAGVLGVARSRLTLACDARAVSADSASAFLARLLA